MEWLWGMYIAIAVAAIIYFFAGIFNVEESWGRHLFLVIFAAVIWLTFGLMFEMPSRGNYLLKVKDGKVVESKRKITMDWDNPTEYRPGIRSYKAYLHLLPREAKDSKKHGFGYILYFRVEDENLNAMQKYYDLAFNDPGNYYGEVLCFKATEVSLVMFLSKKFRNGENVSKSDVWWTARELLKGCGIKVVGID